MDCPSMRRYARCRLMPRMVAARATLPPEARNAAGYARPHELDISRHDEGGGLWATVKDVRMSGA